MALTDIVADPRGTAFELRTATGTFNATSQIVSSFCLELKTSTQPLNAASDIVVDGNFGSLPEFQLNPAPIVVTPRRVR